MPRTKIPLDKSEIEKWARAGSNLSEIAARLGVSTRTLDRRLQSKEYRDLIPKAHAELRLSLRTKQVQIALAGNVTMLIWLGKQLLGQQDKLEHSGTIDTSIDVNVFDPVESLRTRVAELIERERQAGVLQIPESGRTGTD